MCGKSEFATPVAGANVGDAGLVLFRGILGDLKKILRDEKELRTWIRYQQIGNSCSFAFIRDY